MTDQTTDLALPVIPPDATPAEAAELWCSVVPVFPTWWGDGEGGCACPDPDCKNQAKHPLGLAVPHGFKDATRDLEVVRDWWRRWPRANVAAPTGQASGVSVLDCDEDDPARYGDEAPAGAVILGEHELLAWLERESGGLSVLDPWPVHVTQSGGLHVLAAASGAVGSAGRVLPAVDRKADGGYVLLPGSVGATGRPYRQARGGRVPPAGPLAPLLAGSARGTGFGGLGGGLEPETFRESERTGVVRKGTRDPFFNSYAFKLRKRGWDKADAVAELRRVFQGGGVEQPDGDRFGWGTVLEKVERIWADERCAPDADAGLTPEQLRFARGAGIPVGGEPVDVLPSWTVAELRAEDRRPTWLVKRWWPHPSYGPLGGSQKTFKTWLFCLTAVAVASGRPLFGLADFEVVTRGPVVVFTGESGRFALERRLRRVAAKLYGLTDAEYDALPLHVVDERAPISSDRFTGSLRHHLSDLHPVLVVIDPLYAYVGPGVEAGNVFAVGDVLHTASGICTEAGASLMVGYHTRKTASSITPELTDLTQAGGREWTESWVLVGHREDPEPNQGRAHLLVRVGSRHGYGADYEIELEVGAFDVDTFDHTGGVSASIGQAETPVDREERKAETKRAVQEAEVGQILVAVAQAETERDTSSRSLARRLDWGRKRVEDAMDRAIRSGYLEVCGEWRNAELRRLTESGKLRLEM